MRGLVVLRVLVSETGIPLEVEVVQGAAGGLTEAAEAAVAQWRFEPAIAAGEPVRTRTLVRIPFEGVQFATPTPLESPAAPEAETGEVVSVLTPTPELPLSASVPPASAAARLDQMPFPVPPEPPSGETGRNGPVLRTRLAIRLNLSPAQARIWMDGRFVGIADDWDGRGGGAEFAFDRPGPHSLHAELPGYQPFDAEIDVAATADSDTIDVEGQLVRAGRLPYARLPRPVVATRGRVVVAVDRADAELIVDGVRAGRASLFTERDPLVLAGPAVHELKITSPGGGLRTVRVIVSASAPAGVPTLRVRLAPGARQGRETLAGAAAE